jgi:hypothetical protein
LTIEFHFSPVGFPATSPPLLDRHHGLRSFVIRCGQHIGTPTDVGHLKLVECHQFVKDPLPLSVIQFTAEERSIDYLKEKLPVHHVKVNNLSFASFFVWY